MKLNSIESKILKYLLLLVGYFLLSTTAPFSSELVSNYLGNEYPSFWYGELFRYLAKLVFATFLFFDCKKDSQIIKAIPLLGFLQPMVGTIFYFIALFLAKPQHIKSI